MFARYNTKTVKEMQAEDSALSTQVPQHLKSEDLKRLEATTEEIKEKVDRAEEDLKGARARLEKALDKLWASKNELDKRTRVMNTLEYSGSGAFAESKQNWILREEIGEMLDRMDRLGGEELERRRKRVIKQDRGD